jgi:zinc protease
MRLLVLTCSIAALVTAVPALAQAPAAPSAAAASSGVTVAPLNYTERTLPNGLRVLSVRDTSTPNVAVQVWYGVGSKDDPAGRSGFAHLFEHLMFKQTRNLKNEQFDRLTEDVGGFNNASTNDDYTDYFEVVPANHLQRILWAEAERMSNLVVDEAVFKSERDVVKEELRSRVLAQPYGKLFYVYLPQVSFTVSPYARPGIGSIEDLDAATVDDVRAFHATYYRPDNATLFVVGNFDQAQLDRWIDQYFAPVEKPSRPLPRVTAIEPDRTGPAREWTVWEPNTPLPAVLMTFPSPPASDPDMPALMVADAILSTGESSRLYQSLVYEQQLAQQAFSFISPSQQPGAYAVAAILADGKSAEEGERSLRAELARLRDAPVTDAELAEAKNTLVTEALQERETADGAARMLARATILYGDPARVNAMIGDLQKVTAADVQRVARKYLADEKRAVVRYLPEEGKPADAPTYGVAPTVVTSPLGSPAGVEIVRPAPDTERVQPPAPGEPLDVRPPAPIEQRLANGLRIVVAQDRDVPLVTARLNVAAGGAADPAGKPGVASMTAALLTKGTPTRSATRIAQEIEALGGSLAADATYDASSLDLTVKADQLEPAMAVFADVARNAVFADEELERLRQQALNDLQVALSDPGTIASYAAARAVYGAAPYGAVLTGTEKSLTALTTGDVKGFHGARWRPENATLVISGDITPERGRALAQRLFGDWRGAGPSPAPVVAAAGQPVPPRVIVIDLPKSGQAAVAVARRAIARKDQRYYPALVANSILGGGYSSRLNQEIRIQRGLSYGAGSSVAFRREPGPLVASVQTKNESAVEVVSLVLDAMRRLGQEPVRPDELTARKSVLVGGFGRTIETTDSTATLLSGLAVQQVDLSEVGRYVSNVQAVSSDQVRSVAAELFDPEPASIVVVGDAQAFLPALRAKFPQVEVIPVSALNLDSPALK